MVWEGPGEACDRDGLPLGSHVAHIGDDANTKQPRLRALGKMRLLRHGRGKKVRQSRVLAGCRDFWTSVKTAGSKPLPAGGLLKNTLNPRSINTRVLGELYSIRVLYATVLIPYKYYSKFGLAPSPRRIREARRNYPSFFDRSVDHSDTAHLRAKNRISPASLLLST